MKRYARGVWLAVAGMVLATAPSSAVEVKRVQAGGVYGIDHIVIENARVRAVVSPHNGARILSLRWKATGRELVHWDGKTKRGGLGGIGSHREFTGAFYSSVFAHVPVESCARRGRARFVCQGQGHQTKHLVLTRDVILDERSCVLQVTNTVRNNGFTPKTVALRMHNWVTIGSDEKRANVFVPTTAGPAYVVRKKVGHATDGWIAAIDRADRVGLAGIAAYDAIESLLCWAMADSSTLEWYYRPVTLGPGDSWHTQVAFVPFDRLDAVSFAHRSLIGHVTRNRAHLFRPTGAPARVTIEQLDVKGRAVKTLGTPVLDKPGLHSVAFGPVKGECLVRCTLTQAGRKTPTSMVTPFAKGFRFEARQKKPLVVVKGRIDKTTVKRPRPARRPTHGRKRILVLSTWDFGHAAWGTPDEFPAIRTHTGHHVRAGRRAYDFKFYFGQVVYSQRWAFRARENVRYFLRRDPTYDVDVAHEDDFLTYLENLYDYDLVVINDFSAHALAPYKDELLTYVRDGHGLVFFGGYQSFGGWGADFGHGQALEDLMPVRIVRTPDARSQTTYGRPDEKFVWKYMLRPCEFCDIAIGRIGPWVQCTNFWSRHHWRWMRQGDRPVADRPLHPAVSGLPWDTISPNYHAVQAKPGTDVLVSIAGGPLIVADHVGKGRVLAAMICDERRLFFWDHSPRLLKQMADWCCAADHTADVHVRVRDRTITVQVANRTGQNRSESVVVRVVGEDRKTYYRADRLVTVARGAQGDATFTMDPALLPMAYTVEATWGQATGVASLDLSTAPPKGGLFVNFHHKHCWPVGETVTFDVQRTGGVSWDRVALEVTDARGTVMPTPGVRVPGRVTLSTVGWTVGRYTLKLVARRKGRTQVVTEDFYVARKRNRYLAMLGGASMPIYRAQDSYATLASLSATRKFGAASTYLSVYGHEHWRETADLMLAEGLWGRIYFTGASTRTPFGPDVAKNLREPFDNKLKPYGVYPATTEVYVDDEGTARYWGAWHRADHSALEKRFQQRYGRSIRQYPETKQQQVDLANQFDASYNWVIGTYADAIHAIRPDWRVSCVLSQAHCGILGSYLPTQFDRADVNFTDVYPVTVNDIGEDLLTFNMVRTISQRNGKPPWVWLAEYRNRPPSMRMQAWLALGAGMKGFNWYASGGGERTGLYRREYIDTVGPLNRMIRDLAPLVARWRVAPSRIGVVYPRDVLAYAKPRDQVARLPWQKGGRRNAFGCYPYVRNYRLHLQEIFCKLYEHDLYADVISSADLANDTHRQYAALVTTYTDECLDATVAKLNAYGRGKLLALAPSRAFDRRVRLANARPFGRRSTIDALVRVAPPRVVTPDPNVLASLLECHGTPFVVLYNHNPTRRTVEARVTRCARVRKVLDIVRHEAVPFTRDNQDIVVTTPMGPYDGRVIVLLPCTAYGLDVSLADRCRRGERTALRLRLTGGYAGPVVVDVNIIDPTGRTTAYSDKYMIDQGELVLPIDLGRNAMTGSWRVAVKDCFTGTTRTKALRVE